MILCSGCFDDIHAGHVAYLRAAVELVDHDSGEELVCAVAPDETIRRKRRKPHFSQADRVDALSAALKTLWLPASVIAQVEPDVTSLIRQIRPRLFVKGMDWAGQLPEDVVQACQDIGCLIVYTHTPGTHTSEGDR